MEEVILVKSSSGDLYEVSFKLEDKKLSVHCNCQAGLHGMLCKHRISLILGGRQLLYTSEEEGKLINAINWVKNTNLHKVIQDLESVKTEIEQLKKKERSFKRSLARKLANGAETF